MDKSVDLILPALEIKIESLEKDPHCQEFLKQLKTAENVNLFCICGNSYSLQFFEELAPYLNKIKTIKKAIFSDIFVSRKEEIIPSLNILNKCLSNKQMILFDISYNALCPDGCAAIVDILKTNKGMKYLYLNHVALSQPGTVSICEAVKEAELDLISFQAIKNRIEIQAVKVAEMLEKMPNLEELIVFQNNIKDEEMRKMLEALKNCKKLRYLDLSDNYLKPESVVILIDLLENYLDLKVLKISDCNIDSEDSDKLFKHLKDGKNKNLEVFTYNYNDLDDLAEATEALVDFKNLKQFECKGLGLDDEEYEEIKEKIKGVDCLFESEDEDDEEEVSTQKKKEDKDEKIKMLIDDFKHLEFM